MIDAHCHLEQKDYLKDIDAVVARCQKELKAVVTVCAHPKDLDRALELRSRWPDFVFVVAGIHPEFIKEISAKEKDDFLERLKENRKEIVAIGEIGLDYYWVKELSWQEKQKEMFRELLGFARELKKPVTVHSRDAPEETMKILEDERPKAHWHLFGSKELVPRMIEGSFPISMGPIIERSKIHRAIAEKMPLELLMLETDSPWFGGRHPDGSYIRGEPTNVKLVAERIAKEKSLDFDEVWSACGENAKRFFGLPV